MTDEAHPFRQGEKEEGKGVGEKSEGISYEQNEHQSRLRIARR